MFPGFVQILILADESVEDSAMQADSRSLATLLLIRDIQVLPLKGEPELQFLCVQLGFQFMINFTLISCPALSQNML